jgi:hypothetical protein
VVRFAFNEYDPVLTGEFLPQPVSHYNASSAASENEYSLAIRHDLVLLIKSETPSGPCFAREGV